MNANVNFLPMLCVALQSMIVQRNSRLIGGWSTVAIKLKFAGNIPTMDILPDDLIRLILSYIHPQWIEYATTPIAIIAAENTPHRYFTYDAKNCHFDWYMELIELGAIKSRRDHVKDIVTHGTIDNVKFMYTSPRYREIISDFGYENDGYTKSMFEIAVEADRIDIIDFMTSNRYETITDSEEELQKLVDDYVTSNEMSEYLYRLWETTHYGKYISLTHQ